MCRRSIAIFVLLVSLALACTAASSRPRATVPGRDSCHSPGLGGGATPQDLLACNQLTQPVYWLGDNLQVAGLPDVRLSLSYTTNDERPISETTRLALEYAPDPKRPGNRAVAFFDWYRPAWEQHVAAFKGYDYTTVPVSGPVNWWQHPCVEEQVYRATNGAEVHLFRAHLNSLIRIFPMTQGEVAHCLSEPVQLINAHVYFEKTVVQMDVALEPGNQYDSEETVRYLIDSLRPYEPKR